MNKFLPKLIILFLLFIAVTANLWLPTQADEPTAVHLADFEIVPLDNAVRIEWDTGSELDTAGFRIKRGVPGSDADYLDYVGDNGFIMGTGGVSVGGNYSVTDNQVQNGEVYVYKLIEVENSGAEIEIASGSVTVGIPPTNTPVIISGGSGSNPTAAATATSRSTTAATATKSTQSTNQTTTTEPTNTPPSFVTITPRSVQATATASPVPRESTTTNQTNENTGNTDSNTSNSSDDEEAAAPSIIGVAEVSAQEETETITMDSSTEIESIAQTQDGYPGGTPTETAVSEPSDNYPNNTTAGGEATVTPVPVIGNIEDYTSPKANEPSTADSNETTSATQGRVFLWVGFIVALLIFITGIIGSILLFTRKSK